ncbi:hypothetical protein Tco_0545206 [Tanacetum coccineum]
MTSFDYRLNPIYAIKECSTCGVLYTADFCCSKKGLEDKILVPKPPRNCARCGTPVDGPYCHGCALLRKKFKEDLFTYCVENEFFEDLQDTSESSDDNTNVVNAPQEPIVLMGTNGQPYVEICVGSIYTKEGKEKANAEDQAAKDRYWKIPICYDDDEDNTIAITPVLPIEEPDNSLSIPDKMCDVPLCENTTPLNALNEHSEIVVNSDDDNSSSDDDSPYGENIDYVDASPPDVEIVSLEVVEIVDPEVGRIDDDILLTIKDDILREKLLNVNLLIAKIDSLRDNPTPSSEVISSGSPTTHSELSLPDYKAFYVDNDHFKEKNSDSTTTHAEFSQYDSIMLAFFDQCHLPLAEGVKFYHEEFA